MLSFPSSFGQSIGEIRVSDLEMFALLVHIKFLIHLISWVILLCTPTWQTCALSFDSLEIVCK